jgi:hypothetical protein
MNQFLKALCFRRKPVTLTEMVLQLVALFGPYEIAPAQRAKPARVQSFQS